MSFTTQPITASGGTFDAFIGFGIYTNFRTTSSGGVTLTGNVVFNSTITAGIPCSYTILWDATLFLSTFSVSIEGFIMNQADVNQSGRFECYYDGTAWTVQYFADGLDQPQVYFGVESVAVLTSGTVTLTAGVSKYYQRLFGSPTTLIAAYNVTANTAGVKDGTQFFIEIASGTTIGANAFTVFTQTILAADALAGGAMVIATFDATANVWRSVYINKALALTQFPSIAALSVLANDTNASDVPKAVVAATNGQVLMRRSNALAFNFLEADNFSGSTELFTPVVLDVEINSAAILTSFATPVVIADTSTTPGAGLPVFLGALFYMVSGGVAYAANTNIGIRYTGSGDDLASFTGALAATASSDYTHQLFPVAPASGATAIGSQIEFYTKTGAPTTGTRSLRLKLFLALRPAP
jgi:hypothetical protein